MLLLLLLRSTCLSSLFVVISWLLTRWWCDSLDHNKITLGQTFEDTKQELLVIWVEESVFEVHYRLGKVDPELISLFISCVEYLAHEAASCLVVLARRHEVAVPVQEFFGEFNIAGHSKNELLQVACQGILHHGVHLRVSTDAANDGDVDQS